MGGRAKRRDGGMCMRATDQRVSAVRRRTMCEVNKSGGRLLNVLRIEIDDVRSKAVFCTMKSEAETNWEGEATSG